MVETNEVTAIAPDPKDPKRMVVTLDSGAQQSLNGDFAGRTKVGDTLSMYMNKNGEHGTLINETQKVMLRQELDAKGQETDKVEDFTPLRDVRPSQEQLGEGRTLAATTRVAQVIPDPKDPARKLVTFENGDRESLNGEFAGKMKPGDTLSAYMDKDGKHGTLVNETQQSYLRQDVGPDGKSTDHVESFNPERDVRPNRDQIGNGRDVAATMKVTKIEPDPKDPSRKIVTLDGGVQQSINGEFASRTKPGDTLTAYLDKEGQHGTLVNETQRLLLRQDVQKDGTSIDKIENFDSPTRQSGLMSVTSGKPPLEFNRGPGMTTGGVVAGVTQVDGKTTLDYVLRGEHHYIRVGDGSQPGAEAWQKPVSDAMLRMRPGDAFEMNVNGSPGRGESITVTDKSQGVQTNVRDDGRVHEQQLGQQLDRSRGR